MSLVDLMNGISAGIDVETTGVDYSSDEIIQMGISHSGGTFTRFYDCDGEITPLVSSIHNITKLMVCGHDKFDVNTNLMNTLPGSVKYLVAHNAPFDKKMVSRYGVSTHHKWLCTQKMAQKLFQGDDTFANFKLNFLRYRLGVIAPNEATHDAGFDSFLAMKIFEKMLELLEMIGVDDEEKFNNWYDAGQIITTMPFGKHKGKKLVDIPIDYWVWAAANMEILDESSEKYDADFAQSVSDVLEIHISQG